MSKSSTKNSNNSHDSNGNMANISNIRQFGVKDADAYWQKRYNNNDTSARRLHRFIASLIDEEFPSGARVLDCGVGSGHVFRMCRQRHTLYGVEQSTEAISRYDFPVDNIKQADLNNGIPDFGVKFDVIVVSMVLHWLNQPEDFLRQAISQLSEKGKMLIVIPNIVFYKHRLAYLFGKFPPVSLSHKNFQTPPETEKMFRQAGYIIERKLTPRKYWRAKLWPNLFSTDIVYLLRPRIIAMGKLQSHN